MQMQMFVVNSGSSGNGYVIQNDREALVIECGCRLMDVKRKAVDFNVSKIVGAVVSHEHG